MTLAPRTAWREGQRPSDTVPSTLCWPLPTRAPRDTVTCGRIRWCGCHAKGAPRSSPGGDAQAAPLP